MVTDLEKERQRVEADERELVFDAFTNDDALELGLALVERARQRQLAIAIDVERSGQRLFHFAAAGTSPDNAAWIERKKNLVKRVFQSSYAVGLKLAVQGKTLAESMGVSPEEFAAHGGCFPLKVRGVGFVGTVTVSGLPQKDDHDLVVGAIREFVDRSAPAERREGPRLSRLQRDATAHTLATDLAPGDVRGACNHLISDLGSRRVDVGGFR